jgi:hypothetical protein
MSMVTADNIIIATGSEPSYPGDGSTFPSSKESKGLITIFREGQ